MAEISVRAYPTNVKYGAMAADTTIDELLTSQVGNSGKYLTTDGTNVYWATPTSVPSGAIMMWHGSIATIPSGWYLCNGSNGTPDLRNRFIVAADADSGGVAKSTITGSALQTSDTGVVPAHSHAERMGNNIPAYDTSASISTDGSYISSDGAINRSNTRINTDSYGTGTKNIAVFYALAYIMKA